MTRQKPALRTYTIRLNSRLVPAMVAVLLIVQLVSPFKGWYFLLLGLGGAWILSYLWARSLATSLQIKRETRFSWARVGDRLQERFTLSNLGWAPGLWIEVVDHSTLPDGPVNVVASVGGRDKRFWRSTRICTRRGLFTLGPTSLRSGDPFGLYSVEVHHAGSNSVMITPPILPLPHIEVVTGGRTGDERHRRFALERKISDVGVREYLPGDSTKRIHWPTSARHGSLYVRNLEGATSGDWWICLDLYAAAQAGEAQKTTLELGVILAASIADRGFQQGRRVGLVMYGPDLAWLPPRSEQSQRWQILRALALAEPGDRPFVHLLSLNQPGLGHLASLILITPSADQRWVGSLLPLLSGGAAATVLLLDPSSFGAIRKPYGVTRKLAELGIKPRLFGRELLDEHEAQLARRRMPWQKLERAGWSERTQFNKVSRWRQLR